MAVKPYGTRGTAQKPAARRSMLPLIVAMAGLVLISAGLIWLAVDRAASTVAAVPQVGKPLADFTLTDLAGKQVRLSDYKGRPVLINAWATWCPPCQAEMPSLHDLYLKHQAEGFAILAVDGGEDPAIVRSFINERGFTFPVLLDPQTALLEKYGIRDYPTSIVIGRDGTVKLIQIGILTPDAIQKVIEPLIAG